MKLEDEVREETAFTPLYDLTAFKMHFDLKKIPGMFQWTMDVILASVKLQFGLVYHGNTVIFLRTLEKHIDHAEQVLTLFQRAGITVK